ncbi:hypothetical protein PMI15_00270 [Polaromonas sp. CF318]|uniref:hypothetical protein n=1 Tax=Polaromonas sp. CF318 TaxID=1144318 RepID=UPI0002710FA1|nr:hypothetical protein [Polaromonas sp. CF318]EJL90457.1 hypothetical protein PMI15_00270 [Polaromonas sp. CF318]
MKRRSHRKTTGTYGPLAELLASPIAPMPKALRVHQLTRMWQGLAAIETAPLPTTDDWRVCSDAVNLMETLVDMGQVEDHRGLLLDAVAALAMAGKRHVAGNHIRMDGKGIQAIRAVLEDYAKVLEALPHRTMVQCHRLTEKRLREILAGRKRPHDVEITAL